MALTAMRLTTPIQRWGIGILLGLSVTAMALPSEAATKDKKPTKAATAKKETKPKVVSSKKKTDTKTATVSVKTKGKTTSTATKTAKVTDTKTKTSPNKHEKNTKTKSKLAKAKPGKPEKQTQVATKKSRKMGRHAPTPAVAAVQPVDRTDDQGYYIMPGATPTVGETSAENAVPDTYQRDETEMTMAATEPEPDARYLHSGSASYYSDAFDGKRTASGERFDQDDYTCAHGSLPFGCKIRVTNLRNNRSVDVKVNDRGGFHRYGRIIDLSKAAAREIGMLGTGTAKVKVEVLE